jgi:hypothetical protein
MNDPTQQNPTTPCPPWCTGTHVDGMHVAELELAAEKDGYNIYTRPVDYGTTEYGMEVVVANTEGVQLTRIQIEPDEVAGHAMLSDLRKSLTAYDNGTPLAGEAGGHQ